MVSDLRALRTEPSPTVGFERALRRIDAQSRGGVLLDGPAPLREPFEGQVLRIRLEALRERYGLNVPDESDAARTLAPTVIRILCSDGLVE